MVNPDYSPKALLNRPELWIKNRPLMAAFGFLSPKRPTHFSGVGAIPLMEILAYCQIVQTEGDDREEFVFLISQLDDFYVQKINEKQAAKNGG
jgi:hypothetical protein